MLHKFLLVQVTILVRTCHAIIVIYRHAVNVEINQLMFKNHVLANVCVLNIVVAQHTVVSFLLQWLYHRLVFVLDQEVHGAVLVLPAEDVNGAVSHLVYC